jgi:hypothetical protein
MGFFIRRPRLPRVRRPFRSVRVGPVRVYRKGGGSVSAGPVGFRWRKKRR